MDLLLLEIFVLTYLFYTAVVVIEASQANAPTFALLSLLSILAFFFASIIPQLVWLGTGTPQQKSPFTNKGVRRTMIIYGILFISFSVVRSIIVEFIH
jgi:hypothetical protein